MHNDEAISTTWVELKKLYLLNQYCSRECAQVSLESLMYIWLYFLLLISLSYSLTHSLVLEMGFNSYNFLLEHWVDSADTEHHAKRTRFPFFSVSILNTTLLLPDLRLIPHFILSSKEKQTYTFDMLEKTLPKMQLT